MKRIPLAAVAILVALPLSAADAAPKKKKAPSTASFRATVTGTQVTTWSYRSAVNPDDPCDAPSAGDGSQTIRFTAQPKGKLTVFKGKVLFGGRTTIMPVMDGKATIEREGDYKVSYPPADQCGDGLFGGDGSEEPKDCGTRTADISTQAIYEPEPPDDWGFLVPLTPAGRVKKSVGLTGEMTTWSSEFVNCPWWIAGSEDGPPEDGLLFSTAKFSDKRFFDKRRKSIVVSADRTFEHRAEGFTGKTLITWNLRLKRLK